MNRVAESLLRSVVWPVIDAKNNSVRLREWRELERNQWDSADTRSNRRIERLSAMVHHAYATVPFYRKRWGIPPVIDDETSLQQLPVVSKSDIRDNAQDLISTAFDPRELVEARTGGSTGTALRVLFDARCQDRRNAAALRSNKWAGWLPAQAAGALWGNPPVASSFRDRVRSILSERVVYLDTVALTERSVRIFMAQLRRQGVRVLFGHAHSLFIAARHCKQHGIAAPTITSIISTSMMLLETERRFIEQFFGCPVTDRYGCEEVGLIAAECERRKGLHVNDDHVIVEILRDDGMPAEGEESGRVVVTDLLNRGMPLIRYAVGDMSSWMSGECDCGRHMRRLRRVLGRTADFLRADDGKLVAGVSLVERTLTAIEGVEQMQIVQHTPNDVTLRCVLSPHADRSSVSSQLIAAIRDALSPTVRVVIEVVPQLSQDPNGKYRFSICECQDSTE